MTETGHRSPLRIGLAQIKPVKGDISRNLEHIRKQVASSGDAQDLLIFPEAALSGYFLMGGVTEAARTAEELAAGLGLPPASSPDLIIGFYERWRRRLYNSVAYLTPGDAGYRVEHVHRKIFLPTYGVFDEERFIEPGRDVRAFNTRFGRMGMLVCEDAWHSLPPSVLALDGAELIVVVSASPARGFGSGFGQPENLDRWDALASGIAIEHGVFVAVSQLVGSEGGKLFPGGSLVAAPDGAILVRGPLFQEGVTEAELEGADLDRVRFDTPLLADLERMLPHLSQALERATGPRSAVEGLLGGHTAPLHGLAGRAAGPDADQSPLRPRPDDLEALDLDLKLVEQALVEFIREEVIRRRGFGRVVIGLSGGVDSAVSLYLAVRALGPENVFAFRLPYATSSQESLDHAALLLEATGAQGRTIGITPSVDGYVEHHEPDLSPLRRGNLAARLRSVTLFDQSARLGALPLGTGNKSERLLGYFTWHADDSPPINPLGDLYKTQVWALARHLGIPDVIIDKPASADLVRGVHDEDELGISYHRADPILHWTLRGYTPEQLIRRGFDSDEVALVLRRLNSTHWKRERPTVAVLSSSAIGEFYLRPVDY